MKVPFLDLKAHHEPLREQLDAAIAAVINNSAFAGGPFVANFERDYAAYCGARAAIGVGNGTDALWLALLALGIGPGDEVITVPNSFMATAEAISLTGAKPVFVDVDGQSYNMDASLLQAAITPRTRAIIPVHLFGQIADMDSILGIAGERGIPVVEDACQAHGAMHNGKRAGTLGVAGCFSFYPGKNLGAFGEAGAVVTDAPELEAKIRVLRDHGQARKYYHSHIGWNARMDGIQGAVLAVKLKHLDAGNARRRAHARLYDELLREVEGVVTPFASDPSRHVYHVYAVRVKGRDQVLSAMADRGISCAIHYPVPIHLQDAYRGLGYRPGDFPVAERCAREFLSLPMFPELTEEHIHFVAAGLKACVNADQPPESVAATELGR
jgi:dTDP-4-amino-4,6-dideoxygalactose transaminase